MEDFVCLFICLSFVFVIYVVGLFGCLLLLMFSKEAYERGRMAKSTMTVESFISRLSPHQSSEHQNRFSTLTKLQDHCLNRM